MSYVNNYNDKGTSYEIHDSRVSEVTAADASKVLTVQLDGSIKPQTPDPGTVDYTELENKPQIGGVTLLGNKTASDLALAPTVDGVVPIANLPTASTSAKGLIRVGDDFDIDSDGILSLYKTLTISGTVTPEIVEKGTTQTTATLNWTTNKVPTAITVEGISVTPTDTSKSLTGLSLTADKQFTIAATDGKVTKSATPTLHFYNGIYWGVATNDTASAALITSLGRQTLSNSKSREVTFIATSGQYYWYCYPASLGTSIFKVDGIEGGFETPATVSFTNSSGYTENYYAYRSTQHSLGTTTVVII